MGVEEEGFGSLFTCCRGKEVGSARELVRGMLGGKDVGIVGVGMGGGVEEVVEEVEGGEIFSIFTFCSAGAEEGVDNIIFWTGRAEGVEGETGEKADFVDGVKVDLGVEGEEGEEGVERTEGEEGARGEEEDEGEETGGEEEGGMTPNFRNC